MEDLKCRFELIFMGGCKLIVILNRKTYAFPCHNGPSTFPISSLLPLLLPPQLSCLFMGIKRNSHHKHPFLLDGSGTYLQTPRKSRFHPHLGKMVDSGASYQPWAGCSCLRGYWNRPGKNSGGTCGIADSSRRRCYWVRIVWWRSHLRRGWRSQGQ